MADPGVELPDVDDDGAPCCMGSAMRGPDGCSCWREVHDLAQTEPDPEQRRLLAAGVQPNTRATMCGDCAYRPGSPEKSNDPGMAGNAEQLEQLAESGTRFWCHDGLRRRLAMVHPLGVEVKLDDGAYDPPIRDGVPYQANGQPGLLCAGWSARHRALAARSRSHEG